MHVEHARWVGELAVLTREDRPAAEHPADGDRHQRRGDQGAHGDPHAEAQIGVGGPEDHGHQDPDDHRLDGDSASDFSGGT